MSIPAFFQTLAAVFAIGASITGILATGKAQSHFIYAGGVDEMCTGAFPDWWTGPCRCPIPGETEDFCSVKVPADGETGVEDSGCVSWPEEVCTSDGYANSCGNVIYACDNATCDMAPSSPYPQSWGCHAVPEKGGYPCNAWTWGCADPG